MAFTWLVPEPLPSFFGKRKFNNLIMPQRVIVTMHALEYLKHAKEITTLREIKELDEVKPLSGKARLVLGPDLERAFRVSPSSHHTRRGVLMVAKEMLSEDQGEFTVRRGRFQEALQSRIFGSGELQRATKMMQFISHCREAYPELFLEVRQSRDFAIPDEEKYSEFFTVLANGRLTNEKGFSARAAELLVFATSIDDGQPMMDVR